MDPAQPPAPQAGPLAHFLHAHRAPVLVAMALGCAALAWAEPPPWAVFSSSTVATLVGWPLFRSAHTRRLCPECAVFPAEEPEERGAVADDLAAFHLAEERPGRSLLGLVVAYTVGAGVGLVLPGQAAGWGLLLVAFTLPAKVRLQQVHARYRVWCPECTPVSSQNTDSG